MYPTMFRTHGARLGARSIEVMLLEFSILSNFIMNEL